MKIIVWITDGTWEACVDAARELPAGPTGLLHVIDPDSIEAVTGARAGLLGRAMPEVDTEVEAVLATAQSHLLDAALERLDRPATRLPRRGRAEHEAVAACSDADLLILARDGDHTRLGPRSLGHATRFVVDHAPCRVLLVWPDQPPSLAILPPPPGPGPGPGPHDPPPPPRPPH